MVADARTILIFGENLARERAERLLTREALFRASGVSIPALGRIEGQRETRIYRSTAKQIATALGLSDAEFIERIAVPPRGRTAKKLSPAKMIIALSPAALKIAEAGAKAQGVTIEQWVNLTIEELARKGRK